MLWQKTTCIFPFPSVPSRASDCCGGRRCIELKLNFDFFPPCITFYEYWFLDRVDSWMSALARGGNGAAKSLGRHHWLFRGWCWLQETAALPWCLALTCILKTHICVCLKTPSSCFLWITSVLGKYWYSFGIITVSKTVARTVLDLEPNLLLLKSYSGPNSLLNWGDIFWNEHFKVVFQKFHLEGWRNDVYSEQLGMDKCDPEHLHVAGIALNRFNCKFVWIKQQQPERKWRARGERI